MRILITSDLHYNVARSRKPTRALAERVCQLGGDVLIFAGDIAADDPKYFDEVFGLFGGFNGHKLAIAGNHDIWTTGGADSLERYRTELAEIFARNGVHYLDAAPFYLDETAFVGNMGWYDFSFRPSALQIPLRFYQGKVAPGAAARLGNYGGLLTVEEDVSDDARAITTRWMDGVRVKLPVSDVAFTSMLAEKLRDHLQQASTRAERIVTILHHLPFAELVPHSVLPNWEFATAFHGSEMLGEVLLEFDKVSHMFCGHIHREKRCRKGSIECMSIGSGYKEKAVEVLEI